MNEKFNKNAKVEQLTKMFLSREEEKGLIVKDPLIILVSNTGFASLLMRCGKTKFATVK